MRNRRITYGIIVTFLVFVNTSCQRGKLRCGKPHRRSVELIPIGMKLIGRVKVPNCGSARDVLFSPNGQNLAVGCEGGAVAILDIPSLSTAKRLEGNKGSIQALAFDASGQFLATACNAGRTLLWKTKTGRLLADLSKNVRVPTKGMVFARDGKSLLCVSDHAVERVDWTNNRVTLSIRRPGNFTAAFFINRGRSIVTVDENSNATVERDSAMVTWDAKTGKKKREVAIEEFNYVADVKKGMVALCRELSDDILLFDFHNRSRSILRFQWPRGITIGGLRFFNKKPYFIYENSKRGSGKETPSVYHFFNYQTRREMFKEGLGNDIAYQLAVHPTDKWVVAAAEYVYLFSVKWGKKSTARKKTQ